MVHEKEKVHNPIPFMMGKVLLCKGKQHERKNVQEIFNNFFIHSNFDAVALSYLDGMGQ